MQRAVIVIALLILASAPALAQDPVKVAAKQCKVALENDYVRVCNGPPAPVKKPPCTPTPRWFLFRFLAAKPALHLLTEKRETLRASGTGEDQSDPDKHSSRNWVARLAKSFKWN